MCGQVSECSGSLGGDTFGVGLLCKLCATVLAAGGDSAGRDTEWDLSGGEFGEGEFQYGD